MASNLCILLWDHFKDRRRIAGKNYWVSSGPPSSLISMIISTTLRWWLWRWPTKTRSHFHTQARNQDWVWCSWASVIMFCTKKSWLSWRCGINSKLDFCASVIFTLKVNKNGCWNLPQFSTTRLLLDIRRAAAWQQGKKGGIIEVGGPWNYSHFGLHRNDVLCVSVGLTFPSSLCLNFGSKREIIWKFFKGAAPKSYCSGLLYRGTSRTNNRVIHWPIKILAVGLCWSRSCT